ncbi:HlyD family efflux transporter periplasmic adaptor subunit [Aequorivita sp. H23M31]|uniref:HlyD family efflux transporter periplasmic adaptor subunit n=1 Tax=Aequorivita ciconiae TaxID=2494375 RepID=A0A410G5U7_9FLAO|nr:efflux RND transporter periplasmic adaptor subunit [Aequorivita sp. H23M31]QAA82633.1 HlyD family efflux transporter periplasmic adaptor subunit [Aequorivita sp. H23M31]
MIKNLVPILIFLGLLASCGEKETKTSESKHASPIVSNDGKSISFPDEESISFFETETVGSNNVESVLTAPGKIVATVLPSGAGASQNIILFDNPELSSNYTQLLQHRTNINQIQNINIKQKQLELERTKDLLAHGLATGQDLLTAETELSIERSNLLNERSALLEHETQLKSSGFNAEVLQKAKTGTAYLICDIPENQIRKIEVGQTANAVFTSFPNDTIPGKIAAVADMMDASTRMLKVRVELNNADKKLKTGMFATVSFGMSESDFISVSENAVVTIQGRHYVFVKTSPTEFERREIQLGTHMGKRIIVFSGLENDEEIAVEGAMQLKGLSFGY